MTKWIVVDLDGTLCNADWRVEFAKSGDWDGFHSRCIDDEIVPATAEIVRRFGIDFNLLILTGRNCRYRSLTLEWFQKKSLHDYIDVLGMRPDDDFRPDVEFKIEYLSRIFGSIEKAASEILFAMEDRDKVVEAYRENGIVCHQVRQGDY